MGRTTHGCLGPEWWSTAGSARTSPNQNGLIGGGCTPNGITLGKSKGPWGWQSGCHWWWGSGSQKGEGMEVWWGHVIACKSPWTHYGCLLTLQHVHGQAEVGYSPYQYLQWWCHPHKTKASFEQWCHEVWCVKDHYQDMVVWKSIIQSLKGDKVDMTRYMGLTASIDHILPKLSNIFGTVVSFDVLMQFFYKVRQVNNEKVPSFAMRLEGTLNQIQLQCPSRMTDIEAPKHIRDCLFHGVRKHIHDSIWYLYSPPHISYSKLMIAAKGKRAKMRRPRTR